MDDVFLYRDLQKLIKFDQVTNNPTISYSPRRLSVSFYCGKHGYHLRFKPGAKPNIGMDFGTTVDTIIKKFVQEGTVPKPNTVPELALKALDYFIINAPAITESTETESSFSTIYNDVIKIDDTNQYVDVIVGGYPDVVFNDKIVEIKTGKPSKWHEIQALTYATVYNRPTQILYVTNEFSIYVEPNLSLLKNIIKQSVHNEIFSYTARNEHCVHCTLKPFCQEFSQDSSVVKLFIALEEIGNMDTLHEYNKSVVDMLKDNAKRFLLDYLTPNITYNIDGYGLRTYANKDKSKTISYSIKKIKTASPFDI